MAVIIKYPAQSKIRNKEFLKRKSKELTNLDWAKWGGWFDTDGAFDSKKRVRLGLADREAVELFSKTFETSMVYIEGKTITPEPYRREYISKVYESCLRGEIAEWFARNVAKFILIKKEKIFKLVGEPFLIDDTEWTDEEFIRYIATAYDGDGCFGIQNHKHNIKNMYRLAVSLNSSNVEYLATIKSQIEKRFKTPLIGIHEGKSYETKVGTKTKYVLQFYVSETYDSNHPYINFLRVIKDHMTLSRKKNKLIKLIELIDLRKDGKSA